MLVFFCESHLAQPEPSREGVCGALHQIQTMPSRVPQLSIVQLGMAFGRFESRFDGIPSRRSRRGPWWSSELSGPRGQDLLGPLRPRRACELKFWSKRVSNCSSIG